MAIDIGPKIGIDGEAEFRKSLQNINQQLKTLGSEMKAVTSAFTDETSAQEKSRQSSALLREEISKQREKIELLKKGLDESAAKYGENDDKTLKWKQTVAEATSQLNSLEGQLKKTEDAAKTEKFEKLKTVMSGVGSACAATAKAVAAVGAAAAGIAVSLGKEVVSQFGELEQNLGGSEAVFEEYAGKLQKLGEDAYKNLGASQSDYLATANKMGSLFQGSGLEVQESFDLTTKAMQRAADVASVMGISTESALESIAGAAKGNFTMMDNLGVAMNATTLQAYALEKGLVSASEVDMSKVEAAQYKVQKAQLSVASAQEKYNAAVAKYGADSTQARQAAISLEKAQVDLAAASSKVEAAMQPASESTTEWWNSLSNADKARVAMEMFFEKIPKWGRGEII